MIDPAIEAAEQREQRRFARLRAEFHALTALSLNDRHAHLRSLQQSDPDLHGELRGLLGAFDEADLAPMDPDRRGQRFGPFVLEAEIGRGGMGVVYRARRADGAFEQQVALKLLPVGARSHGLARRFLRERQILARLAHPAIVRLLDGGVGPDGRPWLAMEYVDGVDLARACCERALNLAARIDLSISICGAVAHAHNCLIVHRDIKPTNILVDAEGQPHLLDFGIARLDDDTDRAATVTAAQALTPRYAAPEQLAGERATTASDVYALGVVLRELVDSAPQVRKQAAARAELALIVAKATTREPAERYASVAMLGDDLRDWRNARPLRSGIGSARARLASLARQYRWPLASVIGVVLALAVGALLTWRQAAIAEREARQANAHLQSLLDVLSAASPEVYAGREPRASEFLIEAARRLQAGVDADPMLIWRSHSQIGVGLMNLGHFAEAEALLQTALSALGRIVPADPARELDTLRYLTLAQRGSASAAAITVVGERIAHVAQREGAPAGAAISALASAASSLSRVGDPAPAYAWLALAERLRLATPGLPPEALENYWRQRGWTALRGLDLPMAQSALAASLAVIDAQPAQFSALRRAEAEALLAEVALLQDAADRALAHLARAEAAINAEYAVGHPERAAFAVLQARALLADGDYGRALAAIEAAVPILVAAADAGADSAEDEDAAVAVAVLAHARAANSDCAGARALLARLEHAPVLASRRVAWRHAIESARTACTVT